jgi:hypothetical protein
MNDYHNHFDAANHLENTVPECPAPEKILISPLGWSIAGRLIWAAAASALLWLAVARAVGLLS